MDGPLLGNLELKLKTFCAIPQVLRFLKDWILFAEKDEELQKIILRQHQTAGADKVGGKGARSRAHARPDLEHAGQR